MILSPHGRRTGVYSSVRGDLAGFGYPEVGVEIDGDGDVPAALAAAWDKPLLEEPIDHGILVPLLLGEPRVGPTGRIGILGAALSEDAPEQDAVLFAEALTAATTGQDVLFVASANGSAGLTPRAPLTELEGARALESRLLDALRTDAARVEVAARVLASEGGSCGAGPLVAFARLFSGRSCRVLEHDAPVGVGYTVAVTDD